MPSVLITGAAGFIGENTVREFVERGWYVYALVHRKASDYLDEMATVGRVKIIRGDLNDFSEIRQKIEALVGSSLDAIVHCAGRASDVGRRAEFKRLNYDSVKNLCDLTLQQNVGRFVFISTTDVYGIRDFNGESEDELPLINNTGNPYPEYKIASEELIRKTLPRNSYSIIRPAAVWGVGDRTLTPRIVGFLKSSPVIIHFGKWRGRNRWPLAHVKNVSAAIYLAATLPEAAGDAINVLDSEVTTIDEFYRIVSSIYLPSKQLCSVTLPMWLGKIVGAGVTAVSNLLNLDHPITDPSLYALHSVSCNLDFSNAKMLRLFERAGLKPVSLQDGIEQMKSHLNNTGSSS